MRPVTIFWSPLLFALIALFIVGCGKNGKAQADGNHTFRFLDLPSSAREAAFGGKDITVKDGDLTMANENPALLDSTMHSDLALSYVNYFSGINYGTASYARDLDSLGTVAGTIRYIDYGTFRRTNRFGIQIGQFRAADYALQLGYGYPLNERLSIGGSFKLLYSQLASYRASGVALDLGASYRFPEKGWAFGATMRNAGFQVTAYHSGERASLPFAVALGISKDLKKSPFRFTLTADHLEKWDLLYGDTLNVEQNQLGTQNGADTTSQNHFGDRLMRHLSFSTEISITQNFQIRAGYDYRRRQELKLDQKPGLTGFSVGIAFRISRFHFSYGRSGYHQAGATNHFTVTTSLSDFRTKK